MCWSMEPIHELWVQNLAMHYEVSKTSKIRSSTEQAAICCQQTQEIVYRVFPLLEKEASNSRLRYLGSTESLPAGLNCESCGGFDEGTAGVGLFSRAQCPRGCL